MCSEFILKMILRIIKIKIAKKVFSLKKPSKGIEKSTLEFQEWQKVHGVKLLTQMV